MMVIERYPSCFVLPNFFMASVTQDGWEWARCTLNREKDPSNNKEKNESKNENLM